MYRMHKFREMAVSWTDRSMYEVGIYLNAKVLIIPTVWTNPQILHQLPIWVL